MSVEIAVANRDNPLSVTSEGIMAFGQLSLPGFSDLHVVTRTPNLYDTGVFVTVAGEHMPAKTREDSTQLPLFVRHSRDLQELPNTDPLALKSLRDDHNASDVVRSWAARTYWDAYKTQVRGLSESSHLGVVSPHDFPDRLRAIDAAFGLLGPKTEIDGRVEIGTLGITDPRARIALARQEDADRQALHSWSSAGYEAGKPGNAEFTLEDAGIDRELLTSQARDNGRHAEEAIHDDVLYSARVSDQSKPSMYAYHGAVDPVHGPVAVREVFEQPAIDARAQLPRSARLAQAGMPYLATVQRVEELGDEITAHLPPWAKPVAKGAAKVVGLGVGAAIAAACATPTPEAGHLVDLPSLSPAGPDLIKALTNYGIVNTDCLVDPTALSPEALRAVHELNVITIGTLQELPSDQPDLDTLVCDVVDGLPVMYLTGPVGAYAPTTNHELYPVNVGESGRLEADPDRVTKIIESSLDAHGVNPDSVSVSIDPTQVANPSIAVVNKDGSSVFVQVGPLGDQQFDLPRHEDNWREVRVPIGVMGNPVIVTEDEGQKMAIIDENNNEKAILGPDFEWRDPVTQEILPVTATPPPAPTPTEVLPTATPLPTEVLEYGETYLTYDTRHGPQIEDLLRKSGIRIEGSAVLNGFENLFKQPGGTRELEEINSALIRALSAFTRTDGTLDFPEEITSFTWQYRQDQQTGVMVPQVFFETEDGDAFMLDKAGRLIHADIVRSDGRTILVPALENGVAVVVTPDFVLPTQAAQPQEQQATVVPPTQDTEVPPVVAPTSQPEQPPAVVPGAEGLPFTGPDANGDYVCRSCPWMDGLAKDGVRISLSYGPSGQPPIDIFDGLSRAQFDQKVIELEGQGYTIRAYMGIWQKTDPSGGLNPYWVWYRLSK